MLALLIITLRYLFLILLVVILFRLVKWMIADLHGISGASLATPPKEGAEPGDPGAARDPAEPDRSILVVLDSDDPALQEGDSYICDRGELMLGRSDGCDVVVAGAYASARHARLYYQAGQFWLEDLHSTNGTYINGRLVSAPVVLANGDRLRIGGVTFQYVRWTYEMGADHG